MQLNGFVYSYANKLFLNLLEPDRIDFSLVSFTIIHTIFSSEKEKKKSSEININNKSILVSIKLKSKLHDMTSLSFRLVLLFTPDDDVK